MIERERGKRHYLYTSTAITTTRQKKAAASALETTTRTPNPDEVLGCIRLRGSGYTVKREGVGTD